VKAIEYGKGTLHPSESVSRIARSTGARIFQITNHPSINHLSYFLQSSFTPDSKRLIFTSYRTGNAQLFEAGFPDGDIRQLTAGAPIHPYSPTLSPDGERVYFVRGGSVWALDRASLRETRIVEFAGAQLGECTLGDGGRWITAAIKQGSLQGIVTGRSDGSDWRIIPFTRTVIHPQFHPLDPGGSSLPAIPRRACTASAVMAPGWNAFTPTMVPNGSPTRRFLARPAI